jgi:hypothetical protein
LQLTLLAPAFVEAILDGHAPDGLGLAQLMQPFPVCWEAQRAELFNATAHTASERKAA